LQTPESKVSMPNATPSASSSARDSSTSATPSAIVPPNVESAIVRLPVSYSTQRSLDE